MMNLSLKLRDQAYKKFQKAAQKAGESQAEEYTTMQMEGADGIWELGGVTLYCFTKKSLREHNSFVSADLLLPGEL